MAGCEQTACAPPLPCVSSPPAAVVLLQIAAYVQSAFGGVEPCRKAILLDFFRHAFDGSGAGAWYGWLDGLDVWVGGLLLAVPVGWTEEGAWQMLSAPALATDCHQRLHPRPHSRTNPLQTTSSMPAAALMAASRQPGTGAAR